MTGTCWNWAGARPAGTSPPPPGQMLLGRPRALCAPGPLLLPKGAMPLPPFLPSFFPLRSFLVLLSTCNVACVRLSICSKGSEGETECVSWGFLWYLLFSSLRLSSHLLSYSSFLPISAQCSPPPGSLPDPSHIPGALLPATVPRAFRGLFGPCLTPVLDTEPQNGGGGARLVPLYP